MMEISARKFKLRSLRRGDEVSITAYANNLKIYKATLALPYPYARRDAREWIEQNLREQQHKHPGMVSFAIDIDGEAVGCIGFSDVEPHKAEVGYWLAEPFWGQGIGTQALRLVTRYGFEQQMLRRIFAQAFPFNKASIRVLEKAGYKLEGRLRKNEIKDGRLIDTLLYAKIR
ncbi:MAG TPA: GNAT family protein [Candidatus Anoxymicrobiaceae bacterium]